MKINPRTTQMFFTLLAHRERYRVRPGLITAWMGRRETLPIGNRTGAVATSRVKGLKTNTPQDQL
jgi:hypothetical protein